MPTLLLTLLFIAGPFFIEFCFQLQNSNLFYVIDWLKLYCLSVKKINDIDSWSNNVTQKAITAFITELEKVKGQLNINQKVFYPRFSSVQYFQYRYG